MLQLHSDPEAARAQLRELFEDFLTGLVRYFSLPRWHKARHDVCHGAEKIELRKMSREHSQEVDRCIARMQRMVQNLKMLGLPGGEAHRLDQYISKVSIAFDHLSYLKEYRTPQAFRAFARVYILTVGALYGPYYCYVGRGLDKVEHNFGVAIAFACGIQLAMSGLFNVMKGLEDPFSGPGGVDNINVPELVGATRDILLQMERDCTESW